MKMSGRERNTRYDSVLDQETSQLADVMRSIISGALESERILQDENRVIGPVEKVGRLAAGIIVRTYRIDQLRIGDQCVVSNCSEYRPEQICKSIYNFNRSAGLRFRIRRSRKDEKLQYIVTRIA